MAYAGQCSLIASPSAAFDTNKSVVEAFFLFEEPMGQTENRKYTGFHGCPIGKVSDIFYVWRCRVEYFCCIFLCELLEGFRVETKTLEDVKCMSQPIFCLNIRMHSGLR